MTFSSTITCLDSRCQWWLYRKESPFTVERSRNLKFFISFFHRWFRKGSISWRHKLLYLLLLLLHFYLYSLSACWKAKNEDKIETVALVLEIILSFLISFFFSHTISLAEMILFLYKYISDETREICYSFCSLTDNIKKMTFLLSLSVLCSNILLLSLKKGL